MLLVKLVVKLIYAVFSQIRYCRNSCAFRVNFLLSKCRSHKSFDKYHVCCGYDSSTHQSVPIYLHSTNDQPETSPINAVECIIGVLQHIFLQFSVNV